MGRRLSSLIVAAHPDDEVLGLGIWMHRQRHSSVHIVHITDGSPKDMQNAHDLGFRTRRAYALARRQELANALRMAHVPLANCTEFGIIDKEAFLHLPELIERLGSLIHEVRPRRVYCPAYEGGHPDHDAAAFAVATVRRRAQSFEHWEFPLYHAGEQGQMITAKFIGRAVANSIVLSEEERLLKKRMLSCFKTQQEILGHFKVERERFRQAREYDFANPPHRGKLLYECWGWSITGSAWRERAGDAGRLRTAGKSR
jgi:LmbE family N-acetylglucosaminyl deacetylase